MSVNLESVLKNIQSEKNTKLTANNLRYGVNCMGVQGGLHPVTIQGGDVGRAIYLQDTTPEDPNGIWINTDKTYDDIYLENERYATDGSIVFSNGNTTDPSNPIANHNNNSLNLLQATYAQKGNVVHFFGFHSTTSSAETTSVVHRHWKYDFDTNTWTQLSDCPTPQGGVRAAWVGDYIYIFGTAYTVNSDYRQYAYKYDTVNDVWERIADLPAAYSNIGNYGLACCYDNDDTIYIVSSNYHYKYIISTDSYAAASIPGNDAYGYMGIQYYNDRLYAMPYYPYNRQAKVYNPHTNSWSNWNGGNQTWFSTVYMTNSVVVNNRFYLLTGGNAYMSSSTGAIDADFGYINLDNATTNSTKISTRSGFSRTSGISNVPVCVFETDEGPIITFFAGVSSGTTVNINYQMGILVEDKDYSDLENDTLIIYTTDGSMGSYITALYMDDKVINGKIYQRFNDVNFWDAENQTLIKNLRTSYGNGTAWVQIK